MKKREWAVLIILAMVTVTVLLIGIGQIFVTGVDGERLRSRETVWMLAEGAALFGVLCFILKFSIRLRVRYLLLFLAASVFTWIHQVFLPLLLSGIYVLFLAALGRELRVRLDTKRYFEDYRIPAAMADFLLGCACMILLFCVMSLAGLGGIEKARFAALFLAAVLAVLSVSAKEKRERLRTFCEWFRTADGKPIPWSVAVLMAFAGMILLLQAGRMNVGIDYDSLHYGLRSEYVLDNGGGIYENLGSINVVYTYSKGLEILLFPLSGLASFSFFLGFQIWMTAGILAVSGAIASLFVNRSYAILCMAVLAGIPGITNMGITAKTDSITALFQLVMLYFLLLYIKKKRSCYLVLAVDAFLLTMVMKPTALVFSTIAAGTAGLYILASRQLKLSWRGGFFPSLIPVTAMWLLVWLRTFLLTGLPVTSVFYSIWAKLGFQGKYPFLFDDIPSNGGSLFSFEGLKHFAKRLYGVLAAPVGSDMAHVRIAWGTAFLLVFLALFVLLPAVGIKDVKKKEKKALICLVLVFLTVGGASLAALYLLWQVDGNYFMLLYALFGILAAVALGKMKSALLSALLVKLFVPVALFNVVMTSVSSWGGGLGMNPIRFFHAGYYDHWAEWKEKMALDGNGEIWEILAADPSTRVLSFGEQPDMLMFPCSVQSYTDIEGSNGNYYISASPEALISFMEFAKTDYVYLEGGYLRPGTEAWRNVTSMIRRGYLTDIFYEDGNALARFVTEPEADGEEELSGFAVWYWAGAQR